MMVFPKWLCFFIILKVVSCQYEIPKLKLEASVPSGLKVYLPNSNGVQLFAFHGKVNEEIRETEPGEFFGEVRSSTDGYWVYRNADLKLNLGDIVHYWVFVQHDLFGYKKVNQTWRVTELSSITASTPCTPSISLMSNRGDICSGAVLFQEEFNGTTLDANKWLAEEYIPDEPDYEFVIYKKDNTITQVKDDLLIIKPKLQQDIDIYQRMLDLTNSCTRPESRRVKCKTRMYLLHNPVLSGKIVSKSLFSYADITIKAKVPSGEWMFPQIYLEDENYNKLVIAYVRGNKVLTGNDGTDIGGSLLFAGPMLSPNEPDRSKKLVSYRHKTGPLSDSFHIYRLRWTPDQIEFFIDGNIYGLINGNNMKSSGFSTMPPVQARLVLGVGVGGVNDFPNDFMSGENPKPWKNRNNVQVKTFYGNRSQWLPSWNQGGQLQVDYVIIKSI